MNRTPPKIAGPPMTSSQTNHIAPPFPAYPSASRYVALGSVEEAFNRVRRSIDAHEAISLIIGPPGTGKTLICNLLVDQYKATHEVIVLGETEIENRTAFLRHLLHHLGADYSTTPENDLHLALVDRICNVGAAEAGLLIVVDEAQSLSTEVLEAIRKATNIMRAGQPRVSAVVCGAMKLEEVLVDRSLEAFTQRVATRCYLHPMNAHETQFYIQETIRACGAEPDDVISAEAVAAIHHAASGVPRLVNQMMTQAIDTAEEAGEAVISESIVDRAWATLQQLPSPMIDEPKLKSGSGSTIEFGELEALPTKSKKAAMVSPKQVIAAPKQVVAPEDQWDLEEPSAEKSEIHVSSASAMWMDESADYDQYEQFDSLKPKMARSTPLPSALFGDFEIEEEVVVGNSAKPAPAMPAKVESHSQPNVSQPSLESMLHQEIIGLSTYDDSVFVMPDEDSPMILPTNQNATPHLMQVDDDCQDCGCETSCREENWDDYDSSDRGGLRLAQDDSDLLVIEDEMETMRADKPSRPGESATRSVTIDFQSMLMKMRAGS